MNNATHQISLKDSQRKNTLKQNSSAYEKYEYGHLGSWYIKSTLSKGFLNWNEIFRKNVLTGKTPFFVIGPFCIPYSFFFLTLASDRTVLYENDRFSILVLSTEKWKFNFLKKIFLFQKICFKIKGIENVHGRAI